MIENEEVESKIEILNKDNQLKQQKLNLLIGGLIGLFVLSLFFVGYLNLKGKNERNRHTLAENELQIKQLESERKQASLQQHASELEMEALRSQMNPHFIFNCLNAINHFILNNEAETASDYLTKFSRLIRRVLQNSARRTIPLTDELQTLRLYIELERVRFKNRFQFSITVDENIDAECLMIPPMLLQPFVENAIWHGLMQKETAGELTIIITQRDGKLTCIVTDNGVGRQKAAASRKPPTQKKSMGMEITANRLRMLEGEEQSGNFKIVDLHDEEGNNSGTKVIVTIPAIVTEMVDA
jgi:LytS/YehU family sensor histidine kinase